MNVTLETVRDGALRHNTQQKETTMVDTKAEPKPVSRKDVEALETLISHVQQTAIRAEKACHSLGKRVGRISEHEIEKTLSRLEQRAADVSSSFAILLLRETVLTEVNWYCRKTSHRGIDAINQNMVSALDLPPSWWRERSELTIGEWVKTFASPVFHRMLDKYRDAPVMSTIPGSGLQ